MSTLRMRGQRHLSNVHCRLISQSPVLSMNHGCSSSAFGGTGRSTFRFCLSSLGNGLGNVRNVSSVSYNTRVMGFHYSFPIHRTPAPRMAVSTPLSFSTGYRASHRFYTDRLLIGSSAATLSCGSSLAAFHLIVTPLSASLAAATLLMAALTGSMVFLEGEGGRDTQIGAIMGFVIGVIGGFYGKSQHEPWRK